MKTAEKEWVRIVTSDGRTTVNTDALLAKPAVRTMLAEIEKHFAPRQAMPAQGIVYIAPPEDSGLSPAIVIGPPETEPDLRRKGYVVAPLPK